MKLIFLFSILYFSLPGFGQNKKKQIEKLSYRVDSLTRILGLERGSFKQRTTLLEQQIVELDNIIVKLNTQVFNDKNSLKIKDESLSKALFEKEQLLTSLEQKKDSIQIFLVELKKLKSPVKIPPVTVAKNNKGTIKVVAVGSQVWMTKNLDVSTFRNGDSIPQARTNEDWVKAGQNEQPAWSYYDNDIVNGTKYGKLYNWYAVNDVRGLAPEGYHIPSDDEWTKLSDFLGVEHFPSKYMNNQSGFSGTSAGLPGGYRYTNGTFYSIDLISLWWSSTEGYISDAWARYLWFSFGNLDREASYKSEGLSVRCLKD